MVIQPHLQDFVTLKFLFDPRLELKSANIRINGFRYHGFSMRNCALFHEIVNGTLSGRAASLGVFLPQSEIELFSFVPHILSLAGGLEKGLFDAYS